MFNLFRSKGKGVKILLGGLLFMVALSMLLYLVPNYTDPNQVTGDPVLLQVGSKKITMLEAQQEFQQMSQGRVPAEMLAVYFPQYLEGIKQDYAAVEAARRMGITATDDEVLETIMSAQAFAPFFKDGKLVRRAEFEAALAARGGTVEQLFSQIRDQIVKTKLQDVVAENTVVTPQELEEAYRNKYDRATVDYIAFTEGELRSSVPVSDADIQQMYDARKATYQEPEKYSFRIAVLSQDKVAASVKVSEQDLRAQYAAAVDNFRSPEQVRAAHILLGIDGKSDAEKKTIRAKAEDLSKQAKGGADFAELAKKNSEDSGNASLGGDLGTFGRGQMAKEFEDAAFAMKSGEVSGVVTTQFGYHIIKVNERIPSKITPFENVRTDLEREARNSKLADAVTAAKTQLRAEIVKNPAGAAEVARKFSAEFITVTDNPRGGAVPTLGVTPELDTALPNLMPGGVSEALTLPGDRIVVAILDKRTLGRQSTLEEARPAIRELLVTQGLAKVLADRGKEAADRLRKGEDIQAVAKAMGTKVEGASNFGVTDSIPGIGPGVVLRDVFTAKIGDIVGPIPMQGRTVVTKIVAKTNADMAGLAAERASLLVGLKTLRAQQQTNPLWMDSIVRSLTASGDITINQAAVNQIIGAVSR